jgi:hypothetical protein
LGKPVQQVQFGYSRSVNDAIPQGRFQISENGREIKTLSGWEDYEYCGWVYDEQNEVLGLLDVMTLGVAEVMFVPVAISYIPGRMHETHRYRVFYSTSGQMYGVHELQRHMGRSTTPSTPPADDTDWEW